MHHTVTAVGFPGDTPDTFAAVAGGSPGDTDVISVNPGDVVAVINTVADSFLGITVELQVVGDEWTPAADQPAAGDTLAVIGALDSIPDFQCGLFFSFDATGTGYPINAGIVHDALTT